MAKALQQLISCSILTVVYIMNTATAPHVLHQQRAFADVALYEAVLDRLFHDEPDKLSFPVAIILRYAHTEAGEMQFSVVHDGTTGQYGIQRWNLPRGAPTIWEQLSQLASSRADITVDSAVRAIRLEHSKGAVAASSTAGGLLEQASSLQVELSGSDQFFLEGSDYVLIIRSPGRDMRLRIQGPQDGQKSPNAIVRWMTQVRRTLGELDLKQEAFPVSR
jgi:hypothetical protein